MIIDWKRQCEKIQKTNELSKDDPSDCRIYFKQEVVYIRSLIKDGLSYEDCMQKWLQLKNGVASQFLFDKEQLSSQFYKTYNKALSKTYNFVDSMKKLDPISIFTEEIQKINELECDKWIKEYFLVLLIYYKFLRQKTDSVEYSNNLVNWALRQVEISKRKFRSYRDARRNIMMVVRDSKFRVLKFIPIKRRGHYTTYTIPMCCFTGNEIMQLESLDDIPRVFDLLQDNIKTCSQCGSTFLVTNKTKRTICEDCYKKYRREYKTNKDKIYYHNEKE